MTSPEENIEFNILLEAQKALITLADLTNATTSYSKQVEIANIKTKEFADDAGISFQKAKGMLQGLDSELSATTQTSVVFGERGQEAWEKVGEAADSSSKLMVGGVDIVRRAVSFLIGQLLFQLLAAFQNVFSQALDGLKQLETSFYDLSNAEKAMSENGIAVTFQDLEAVVDRLHTKFQGLFSANELQSVVAQIAIATKNLGLSTDQIEKIAQTAATIQLRNPSRSISEIAQTLTTSDLNGRLVSLAKLGVNTTEIKNKENELAASLGVTTNALTENQKATIELEAAYESIKGETDDVASRQNTVSGAWTTLSNNFKDFITGVAAQFAPLIITVLQGLIKLLAEWQTALINNKPATDQFVAELTILVKVVFVLADAFLKVYLGIEKVVASISALIQKIPLIKSLVDKIAHTDTITNPPPDTPTGSPDTSAGATDNSNLIKAEQKTEDELNTIFTENRDKRIDIDTEYQRKLQDDALNNQQKLEDIATKEAQNVQDAYTNYNQKIQDIETSTAQKLKDTKTEAQQKEQQATQKHYDNLVKLRNKYLMDLEDALHNRDARQILRLMEQYKNDQTAEDTSYKQEQQQIIKDEKLKIAQIERDKKKAEQAAKLELQRKLADIALAAARERQAQAINYARQQNDARIAYQRQLQDQQIYLQRKLRDLATAIQAEYNLTASGMAAIDALIGSYAGVSGAGGGTVGSNSTAGLSASSYTAATGINAVLPQSQYNIYDTRFRSSLGLAEGGSFLATTPTKINVAENRPELITATPLGRPGQDVGKLFTQGGTGGGGGQLEVALTLSPDLEARVIRKSLDETANVVAKINRSKV